MKIINNWSLIINVNMEEWNDKRERRVAALRFVFLLFKALNKGCFWSYEPALFSIVQLMISNQMRQSHPITSFLT